MDQSMSGRQSSRLTDVLERLSTVERGLRSVGQPMRAGDACGALEAFADGLERIAAELRGLAVDVAEVGPVVHYIGIEQCARAGDVDAGRTTEPALVTCAVCALHLEQSAKRRRAGETAEIFERRRSAHLATERAKASAETVRTVSPFDDVRRG